jgi:ribosome recycling factor
MKDVLKDAKTRMEKSLAVLDENYASVRVGRANPSVLDRIRVDYYGTPTPINQIAAISVSEARVLTIQPWDISACKAVERAIEKSDLGINPQSDGKVIRLAFPPLSEERRRDLDKEIAKMAEETKVAIRAVRRDAMDRLKAQKKTGEITEDDLKEEEKEAQKLTDQFCDKCDSAYETKKKEIMEI